MSEKELQMNKKNRIIGVGFSVFLAVAMIFTMMPVAYANVGLENVTVSNGLIANFKYEKTIDMKNAPNRKEIPNADFDFTLYAIPHSDQTDYGIGRVFGDAGDQNKYKIVPGKLNKGAASIPFSRVSFRKTDRYDPELTRLMDAKDGGDALVTHILKYDWGEMRSSDHVQTAIARKPLPAEEKERSQAPSDNNCHTWPADTIVWKCSQEADPNDEYPGSYEEGCQNLWDYDFDTFDYVKTFNLHANSAVTYIAYTYRRPLLTHQKRDASGNYISVSKGLLKPHDYHIMCEKLRGSNVDEEYNSGRRLVYRFLLREKNTNGSGFASNGETKIVDFVAYSRDDHILIFNSLEDADSFYNNRLVADRTHSDWPRGRLDDGNIVPDASFTNNYAQKPTKKIPGRVNKKVKHTHSRDNNHRGINKIRSAGHPSTGDPNNIFLLIMITLIACEVLCGVLVYKHTRE